MSQAELRTSVARFEDNERAQIEGRTHGLVKLVADARTDTLLGGHIVGEEAGAMIHQIVAMMASHSPVEPAANAIYAYPTLSGSAKGALLGLLPRSVGEAGHQFLDS